MLEDESFSFFLGQTDAGSDDELNIPPVTASIAKRVGVVYSCSYVLLIQVMENSKYHYAMVKPVDLPVWLPATSVKAGGELILAR